jgi:hyperosmotically inducible periplasmic protein
VVVKMKLELCRTLDLEQRTGVENDHKEGTMRKRLLLGAAVMAMATLSAAAQRDVSQQTVQRIQKEVRHEILMLPYFDVFDNIAFKVEGYNVTLTGQVIRPTLKTDAERVVKAIEGVEKVDNQIEVLPVSPNDDRLRLRLFRAIYGYAALQRYALPVIKPIRIIVKNGNVTLEGAVDSEADKNLVNIRARGVSGSFSVTNNLIVSSSK